MTVHCHTEGNMLCLLLRSSPDLTSLLCWHLVLFIAVAGWQHTGSRALRPCQQTGTPVGPLLVCFLARSEGQNNVPLYNTAGQPQAVRKQKLNAYGCLPITRGMQIPHSTARHMQTVNKGHCPC